ncbi:DUF2267 domain-containing protein [Amycolatopsis sp. NPDC051716]|uniref:DUF2267 domain-containing protein n=1 Tax=Amycolatopsis sp. NPDC051716 TaxID=3155804 RepID=UPI003419AAF2
MVQHEKWLTGVEDLAELAGPAEARAVLGAVVAALARCLPDAGREWLADRLPSPEAGPARDAGPANLKSGTDVEAAVARRLRTTPGRGRYLTQAVLAALTRTDPALAEELRGRLPRAVVDTLAPAGESPRDAASHRPGVPTRLSDEEVARGLRHLTGWSGDRHGIERTVQLPADRITPLVERVQREARTMNEHAHVERADGGVTFRLRTGRDGVVTEPDLWLAERIDEAVAAVGSGGRPG